MIYQRLSLAQIKLIRSLRLKKHRQRTGYFVAEGDKSVRSLAQSALSRLDLVSREEFDAQAELLARTRARVAELEAQLEAMASEIDKLGG